MKINIDIDNQLVVKLFLIGIVALCMDTQMLLLLLISYSILSDCKLPLPYIKEGRDLTE